MKKFIFFVLLLSIAIIPAMAQKNTKAPDAVQQAFQFNFNNVSDVSWHKMASGNWYADFSKDSIQSKAEYSPDGQWIATRTSLPAQHLPDTLTKAITIKYPSATITQITHIARADVQPYYQIALETGSGEKDILANNSGTIVE
jgi:hypothetical protein